MPSFPITHSTPSRVRSLYFYSLHRVQQGPPTSVAHSRIRNTIIPRMVQRSLQLFEDFTSTEEDSPNLTTTTPAAVDAGELELPEALTPAKEVTHNPSLTTTRPAVVADTEELCVICFSEFEMGNTLSQTVCMHKFHQKCIEKWLETAENCPICRTDLQGRSDDGQVEDSNNEE